MKRPVARVIAAVAAHYNLSEDILKGPCRKRRFARPRQVAMYLARQMTSASTTAIGQKLGSRDHTTVIHGVRQVAHRMTFDARFAAEIEALKAALEAE